MSKKEVSAAKKWQQKQTLLLRQNIEGILNTYKIIALDSEQSIESIRELMHQKMHTYDERKAFYEHVLHQEMPTEDENITQDLIDQIIG